MVQLRANQKEQRMMYWKASSSARMFGADDGTSDGLSEGSRVGKDDGTADEIAKWTSEGESEG